MEKVPSGVDFGPYIDVLFSFWPRGGPVLDALAAVEFNEVKSNKGVLLVEAKSRPPEIYGGGVKAKAKKSKEKIAKAIREATKILKERFPVPYEKILSLLT